MYVPPIKLSSWHYVPPSFLSFRQAGTALSRTQVPTIDYGANGINMLGVRRARAHRPRARAARLGSEMPLLSSHHLTLHSFFPPPFPLS